MHEQSCALIHASGNMWTVLSRSPPLGAQKKGKWNKEKNTKNKRTVFSPLDHDWGGYLY